MSTLPQINCKGNANVITLIFEIDGGNLVCKMGILFLYHVPKHLQKTNARERELPFNTFLVLRIFSETTHNFYHYLCTASWKELPSQWVWTGCFTRVDYVFMNNASEFQAQCLIHSKSLLINKRKNWQLCFSKNKGKDRATWVREETDCCHYSATLMDHLVVSRKADQTYSDDL
jgi:hypothetical protein